MKRTLQVIAFLLFTITMVVMFSLTGNKIDLSVYTGDTTTIAPEYTPDDTPYDPDNDPEMDDVDWGISDDQPTGAPTEAPTDAPTEAPSDKPTVAPTVTQTGTVSPGVSTTPSGTIVTPTPTNNITNAPTETPTVAPTDKPTPTVSNTPSIETPGKFVDVSMDWFDDALFIGDSRTDGLRRYSGIDNADFFCSTGVGVKAIMKNAYPVDGFGTTTLQNLLTKKTYGKIYISLGINEIGGSMNTIVGRYETLLKNVRALQPNAIIYIMANLHVTQARSDKNTYGITNANLNTYNSRTAAFADGIKTYYIDPNVLFDDENGALKSPEYSSASGDGAHIYAKCYKMWADWLLTKGIAQ